MWLFCNNFFHSCERVDIIISFALPHIGDLSRLYPAFAQQQLLLQAMTPKGMDYRFFVL